MYLNTHTYYSLRYGTVSPQEMLDFMEQHGVKELALTDVNNTSAGIDFVRLCKKRGIRPVLGVDVRDGVEPRYILLAHNNDGYEHICRHVSELSESGEGVPLQAPPMPDVFVVYPFDPRREELAENEYMGVRSGELPRLRLSKWKDRSNKLVALAPCTFRGKRDFNAHRLLRAIDCNTLLSKLPRSQEASPEDLYRSPRELKEIFKEAPDLLENAGVLLSRCSIDFDAGSEPSPKNQRSYTANEDLDFRLLRKLAYEGLPYRYGAQRDEALLERVEMELKVIREKGFVSYFLITWHILKYARMRGYFYVGRGSGANSVISYLLRITDVNPIELDLYFERFINLFRQTPPDFDIDFSWQDREDVTRYIFNRFPHVTLLGAYVTFQFKATLRELGKVFGLPAEEIDVLQRDPTKADEMGRLVLKYSQLIQGFPSHLSPHSAGILISEKPIHRYTATFMPPKGYRTTHFDMVVAEDVGLFKWDILGQRGLAKVKEALEIIAYNRPEVHEKGGVDIHDMRSFYEDENVNILLNEGRAMGCFYVESPAMRMLLHKLKVNTYLGLVAASSVIRPGVAQSGMMREYIIRHRDPARRKDAHPVLLQIMPETYGVMVYQEDVIKVAHYFAGLTLGEADILRRGMSGKYRSREEFAQVERKFFDNCREKGYPDTLTADVWRQIESFAGYAFAKGHSASYAVESYQCLFLKTYYPLEYMVAVINNGGGFYRTRDYLHEARMNGAEVLPPCVNRSMARCTIEGRSIYLGLAFIKEMTDRTAADIIRERLLHGEYHSLQDLVKRVSPSLEQLTLLIRAGALRFTGEEKRKLLWEAHFMLNKHVAPPKPVRALFDPEVKRFDIPSLDSIPLQDAYDEIELFGFAVTTSPWDIVEKFPKNTLRASDFPDYLEKTITLPGLLVHAKRTKTKGGKQMNFGTFYDVDGHWMDTTHFPPVIAKYPFQGPGVYMVTGRVVEEFGYYSLEVEAMERIPNLSSEPVSTKLKAG